MILSTASLEWYGLHKIFSIAKDVGVSCLSLDLDRDIYDTLDTEYLLMLSAESGVKIESIVAFERKMDSATVERIITIAKDLSVHKIYFYPPHRLDKDVSWYEETLPQMAELHPELSLAIANVEPKTFLFFIPEYRDATLQSIKKITGHTALSITHVDPESGVDLVRTLSLLGSSINNIFLSDRKGEKVDLYPGTGNAPIDRLMQMLSEWWYKWDITLRVLPKELWAGNIEKVHERIELMQSYVARFFPESKK